MTSNAALAHEHLTNIMKLSWCMAGMRQGRVIKPPTADPTQQQLDGVLVFNEDQAAINCSFGAFQANLCPHELAFVKTLQWMFNFKCALGNATVHRLDV